MVFTGEHGNEDHLCVCISLCEASNEELVQFTLLHRRYLNTADIQILFPVFPLYLKTEITKRNRDLC